LDREIYDYYEHLPLSSSEFLERSILCSCEALLDKMAVANFWTKSLEVKYCF
jgi:hypothetical protein